MGLIAKQLGKVAYVTATTVGSAQTLYTLSSSSLDAIGTHIIIHNTHSSDIVVTLCIVNAGTTADINDEWWQQTVVAGDTEIVDIPIALTVTNDTVQIYADTGSKINAWYYGYTLPDQT